MGTSALIGLLLCLVYNVSGKMVVIHKRSSTCYGDLGCFSTSSPFFSLQRPINFLPQSPAKINARFLLYTRQNHDNVHFINMNDYTDITNSEFSGGRPTKIVSHGFIENGFVKWMKDMKDAFLTEGDYNVILVDWGGGSKLPYTQATANTRVVGALIAKLIKLLQERGNAKPQDFHIIGHSLGAHIAGYAGERTPNLGRITGLDPAGPYFAGTDKLVRLDPTDATFVDAIHSDGSPLITLGFGMMQAVGHADYYPNGGNNQPGCDKDPISSVLVEGSLYDGGKQYVACNHLRSYSYFTESINSRCPFTGYRCKDFDSFQKGLCSDCSNNNCGQMGLHADLHKPRAGTVNTKYYLDTSDNRPFCRYHYKIQVTIGSTSKLWRGKLYASMHGTNGELPDTLLTSSTQYFAAGESYTFMTTAPHDVGDVDDVVVHWHHESSLLNPFQWNPFGLRSPTLLISKVHIAHASKQSTFCTQGKEGSLASDTTARLYRKC
ncbi:pancreatic triacylglycerol lipase-like [Mytilus trossulus]|uniref:pancreatic triacylglycerol lipase-like n=1 Tax=Mytilus trossulus TaxID=6551 RepID=UPI003004FFC7